MTRSVTGAVDIFGVPTPELANSTLNKTLLSDAGTWVKKNGALYHRLPSSGDLARYPVYRSLPLQRRACHYAWGASGNREGAKRMLTVVPWPGSLSISRVPSSSFISELVTDKPSPVPL